MEILDILDKKIQNNRNRLITIQEFKDRYNKIYPIRNKTVSDMDKVNNKIPVNFCKLITDTFVGYCLTKIKVNHKTDAEDQCNVEKILNKNLFNNMLVNIGTEACKCGVAYTLTYLDEEGNIKFKVIPTEQLIIAKDIDDNIDKVIRNYSFIDFLTEEEVNIVDLYTSTTITTFIKTKDDKQWILKEEREHKIGVMPFIEWKIQNMETPIFYDIIELNDCYNINISLQSDENESLRNAYFVLKNVDLSPEALKLIKESSIIQIQDGIGDGQASFLTKNTNISTLEFLNKLEELIFKIANITDLTSKEFATNLSGIAIAYKIQNMENKALITETLFRQSIIKLINTFKRYISIKYGKQINLIDFEVFFKRNLPANVLEELNCANLMLTLPITKETILNNISIISSPQTELKLFLEENMGENMENTQNKKD